MNSGYPKSNRVCSEKQWQHKDLQQQCIPQFLPQFGHDYKSMAAYVFTTAGGAITWQSKRQIFTALSTTKAEYVALSEAAHKAYWLRNLIQFSPPNVWVSPRPVMVHSCLFYHV